MKYKIQNHFVHNGVQVCLNKSAFPYFVLQVKQEKKTQWKKMHPTHIQNIQLTTKYSSRAPSELQWVAEVCRTQNVCWLSTRN